MKFELSGAFLAATVWLLAIVLAWPARLPTAAVALLAAQAVLYAVIAIRHSAADTPAINVRIRRRRSQ